MATVLGASRGHEDMDPTAVAHLRAAAQRPRGTACHAVQLRRISALFSIKLVLDQFVDVAQEVDVRHLVSSAILCESGQESNLFGRLGHHH